MQSQGRCFSAHSLRIFRAHDKRLLPILLPAACGQYQKNRKQRKKRRTSDSPLSHPLFPHHPHFIHSSLSCASSLHPASSPYRKSLCIFLRIFFRECRSKNADVVVLRRGFLTCAIGEIDRKYAQGFPVRTTSFCIGLSGSGGWIGFLFCLRFGW